MLVESIFWLFLFLFLLINTVACFHAYKFTRFSNNKVSHTINPPQASIVSKIKAILFGIDNPRPANEMQPSQPFETLKIQSNKIIECWYIKAANPKGTVILFHGYSDEKSVSIEKSDELIKLGYNTLLVDFMGSGGSEGNTTTIGYKEAEEVKTCYDYLVEKGEQHIFLYGTSMGAVATLKAMKDYNLKPNAIILECPFGSMYQTTCARFKLMGLPVFPMAGLLVFWGGVQNGFWPFSHKPINYAKSVTCKTLLLCGGLDPKVSRREIDEIYANLQGPKKLITYPLSAHESYLLQYKQQWINDVSLFLAD